MFRPRIIPCLLLQDKGLVKTIQFKDPRYIGDPLNAVRIFNEKEADELIFLNIIASQERGFPGRFKKTTLPLAMIEKISGECLMPLTYGGGVTSISEIEALFSVGVEKVAINTHAILNPKLITEASNVFGNQSILVSIDAKKTADGRYEVYTNGGRRPTGLDPIEHAQTVESLGAGEIMITSIDRDGTMAGYDIELIQQVADTVAIPVVACGGAGTLTDFVKAYYDGHASALAAGSLFVFHGRKRAVLISYPEREESEQLFAEEG